MEDDKKSKDDKKPKDDRNINNNEKPKRNDLSNNNKYTPILANSYDIPQINSIMASFWGKRSIYTNDYYLRVLKDGLSYVYKIDKEIIAVCLVGKYEKKIGIDLLCVKEAYQRMGIGKSLLGFCIKNCEKKGYTFFFLHVATTNKPAIKLYKKFGFYAEKLVRDYYYKDESPDRDAYLLILEKGKKTNDDEDNNKNNIKSLKDKNYEDYHNNYEDYKNYQNNNKYDNYENYQNHNNYHNRYFYNHYHYKNNYHNKYNNNDGHYHNHDNNNYDNNYRNYNYNNYGYYNYSNYRDGYWARYNRWNQ